MPKLDYVHAVNQAGADLAWMHRCAAGVELNLVVCLEVEVGRRVGVGDGPALVSGCSCGSFVSRGGWRRPG